MTTPQFILLEARDHGGVALAAYANDVSNVLSLSGGQVILQTSATESEILETGSEPHAVLVLKFPSEDLADRFSAAEAQQAALKALRAEPEFLHAISLPGIPEEGLPEAPIPTSATVVVPDEPGPKAYMLVQGTVSDPEPIGRYMEIIVPLISKLGGVYRVWTDPAGPRVLAGNWPAQYVVFSEWPSRSAARAMWFSETYQQEAIPTRRPASDFTVLLFEGET